MLFFGESAGIVFCKLLKIKFHKFDCFFAEHYSLLMKNAVNFNLLDTAENRRSEKLGYAADHRAVGEGLEAHADSSVATVRSVTRAAASASAVQLLRRSSTVLVVHFGEVSSFRASVRRVRSRLHQSSKNQIRCRKITHQ